MGRQLKSSAIKGESTVERNRRLDRERVARKRNEENLDQSNDGPPCESMVQRKRRLDRERVARKRNEENLGQSNEGPPLIEGESKVQRKRRLDRERVARKRNEENLDQTLRHNIDTEKTEDKKLENSFEAKMKRLNFSHCCVCKKQELAFSPTDTCSSCKRSPEINVFSGLNNMDPGDVPFELDCLSALEELLIAKVHPVISIYRTKEQQMHYSGHVINFPQDVKEFSTKLPNIGAAVNSIIVVWKQGDQSHCHTDFRVCGRKVRDALKWLKQNNQYYHDIEIDETAIESLPEDGNMSEALRHVETTREPLPTPEDSVERVETTNVPFLPVENQERQINSVIDTEVPWPRIQSAPIDEFRTPGYIACAFPKLFPTGSADLRQGRLKKIGDSEYFKYLMVYGDGRFAKHPRFPFFAMNTMLRWNALNQGKVFVRRNLAGKSNEDLKNLLQSNKNITNQIIFFGSAIRGTKGYWFKRCGELLAMVEQLDTPTIFFTLSAADLHWPDLYRILRPNCGDGEELHHAERLKIMCENPLVVATFFEKRGTLFIETVMKKKFDILDYWFRFEWQHRGSPHIHGVFWMNGAPSVEGLDSKSNADKNVVIDYFDKLISTWNPDKCLAPGNVHPCQIRLESVGESESTRLEDYTRMLNKVQRHTVCSEAYCLRKKKGGSKLECRFKFPIEERSATQLVMDDNNSLRLYTKRNDDRLNIHNPFVTTLWRANTDFQPIMSRQAVINYIAKYASKSEPQSESYKDMITTIVDECKVDDPARKAVQKLLMRTVAERDYSAQEVSHILMGYPLYHCTRQFVSLTLKEDNWVALSNDPNSNGNEQSFVDKYKTRPQLYEQESLYNFIRTYYHKGNKWIKRRKAAIVQVYPKLKIRPESTTEQREEYFRQKVVLYLNWRSEANLIEIYDTWESAFVSNNLDVFCHKLDLSDAQDDEYEQQEIEEVMELEEFMVAAQDGPNRELLRVEIGDREIDVNYDWHASYYKYDCDGITTFVSDAKREEQEDERTYEYPNVTLTKEQNEAMLLLNEQILRLKESKIPSICRTIVQGKGGSGKSTVIMAMTAKLHEEFGSNSFRLMAPTGSAAVNIGGSTIHSGLNIGISAELHRLEGEQLRQFQNSMKDVKFLIIDEYSMVGSRLLGKIDQRCREAKPESANDVFGGMCVYLLGDIKQLPPVLDRAPYSKGTVSGVSVYGRIAYHSFQKCIVLADSQRQAGNDEAQLKFRHILDRLSLGESTEQDWITMDSRCSSKLHNFKDDFMNAMRLFPTNELAQEFNMKKLLELNIAIARIKGRHNCSEATKGSSDAAQGLSRELFLCKGARIMLRSNLWTSKGLVNGSVGTIEDIVFRPGDPVNDTLPIALIVKWDNYTGPVLDGGLFPLTPITRYWNEKGKSCCRTQFPVTLAWAITIHKSQGMTLNKAVIDIGEKEFSAGLTYVALSRMKSLSGVAIEPSFGYERLKNIGKSVQLKERICEELRLSNLN